MLTTVTTNIDVLDQNDNLTSLREAIINTLDGGTINFAAGINSITLLNGTNLGELQFSNSLTIDGGTVGVTIHAAANSRIFDITDPTNGSLPPLVTLKGLTLDGGNITGHSSLVIGNGGVIYSGP
jgi:hypothetical protein